MTDIDQGADLDLEDEPSGTKSRKLLVIIAAAAVLAVIAGGAAWYFLIGGGYLGGGHRVEAPLPQYLELKPFVVTVASRAGASRFVQLGVSFQISSKDAGEMIKAILPKVQDALRQTVLGFKAEDMQTQAGLDKLRAAMRTDVNATLAQVLGPERIRKAEGKPGGGLVEQIEFSTLVVE